MTYPAAVYDETRATVKASAAVIVPLLVDLFQPETVIDVGCGEGWWIREFHDADVRAGGIDQHVSGLVPIAEHDLEQPIPLRDYADHDLALCLEVVEHVSPERGEALVAELCALAKTVIFSAAIPGQGGAGHVNEQWPAYWATCFAASGYLGSGQLRGEVWNNERVAPWYRQNLLVFGDLGPLEPDSCPAVVHPEIWGWYRDGANTAFRYDGR